MANKYTLNELEAMASEVQAIGPGLKVAVDDLISELETKIEEIDALGAELTIAEETQFFKGLTEHTHQQLILDWREYICALKQGSENLGKTLEAIAVEKAAREN